MEQTIEDLGELRAKARAAYLEAEHREAIAEVYRAWRSRMPWRWIPGPLRRRVFGWIGPRTTAAAVAEWKTRERRVGWKHLRGILYPGEMVVLSPRAELELHRVDRVVGEVIKTTRARPALTLYREPWER